MKILFLSILYALFICASCSHTSNNSNVNNIVLTTYKSVSVKEFAKYIADTANVVLLDVRTAEEFSEGHIEGATNIDVKRDDFEAISNAQLPKDKTIAVYCRSGRRSKTASEILVTNGFKVVELDSGYNGWVNK